MIATASPRGGAGVSRVLGTIAAGEASGSSAAATNVEMMGDSPDAQHLLELLGRDLATKVLVQTPKLCVYHETAKPGERVKPHRHGTYQVNYVLRGELQFGNQRVTAGMGYFSPDKLYSWRAGEEGAEWIEIHSGLGGIFTDRPPAA